MTDSIISLAEVEITTSLSRSSIYRRIADGTFPKPFPLGGRRIGFSKNEVDAWIKARIEVANRNKDAA